MSAAAAHNRFEAQAPEHLLAALDTAPDALFVIDRQGAVLGFNRRAQELFSVTAAARGCGIARLVVPERRRAALAAHLGDVVEDDPRGLLGRPLGFLAKTLDGSEFPAEAIIEALDDRRGRFAVWIQPAGGAFGGADPAGGRLVDLEDVADVGHFQWWPKTGHLLWSPKLYEILGRDPATDEPCAETFTQQLHPADRHIAGLEAGDVEARHFEARLIRPDGVLRTVEGSRRVTRDAYGAVERIEGVLRDVTDHRQALSVLAAHRAMHDILVAWESCAESIGRLLARLVRALGCCAAGIYLPAGGDGGEPVCRGLWTLPEEEELEAAARDVRSGAHPTSPEVRHTLETGSLVVDCDLGPGRDPLLPGVECTMAVPLRHRGEQLAVLELHWTEPRVFHETSRTALLLIGEQLGEFLARRRGDLHPGALTPREREVLQLAADGRGVPEIADRLCVSVATVRTHFKNINDRLGVRDRASAVAVAMRLGLVV